MLQLGSAGIFCLEYPEHPFTRELDRTVARLNG
jgi:hypothetical protein